MSLAVPAQALAFSMRHTNGLLCAPMAAELADRLRLLADSATTPGLLCRPGHVFPLRARPGGLAERRGRTEAAVEPMRRRGLAPVAVIREVCNDDGRVARPRALADRRWPKVVSIEQIAAAR
ncbi:3,4-dihydroxy-2-butanone-4-phosphate synthase [Amycolatopsis sp. NBC_00438]|uniref:3,4-dihydroxy-2-butanone-4-phosphate synthase n=1 Tax=Amycolatopsis sp. NBC_00438 TaxID=2903558 RepID=UPI002E23CB7D